MKRKQKKENHIRSIVCNSDKFVERMKRVQEEVEVTLKKA